MRHVSAPSFATTAIATLILSTAAAAQSRPTPPHPDPREIPVPPISTVLGTMPGVEQLPTHADLPDVMVMNNGQRVTTVAQWNARKTEMRRILEYYAVGSMPPPPGNVAGETLTSERVLGDAAVYRLVKLTFGPDRQLSLHIGIFTPAAGGPFPAIILQSSTPPGAPVLPRQPNGPNQGRGENVLLMVGPTTPAPGKPPVTVAPQPPPPSASAVAQRYEEVLRRGYALVVYNNNDCAEDTTLRNEDGSWAFRNTRFYPAYPGYDWGVLAGWAWGASRIADYLETDAAIDRRTIVISGASRTGKSAMVAAAFDDRLIGAPAITGGGGMGAYRFLGPRGSETLDLMQMKYPNWFSPNLHQFWGHREKLPFDQHWFVALCAPRPFIALEGLADVISLPDAVRQTLRGAQPAYALFGATDRIGVNYEHHGHSVTPADWTALLDFLDKYARGRAVDRTFATFPSDAALDAALAAAQAAGVK